MEARINVLKITDKEYPPLLRQIHTPPKQLYYRGDISLLSHPNILAVVGSRKVTQYGQDVCAKLLPPCIHAGIIIVSGLAYGTDSIAHQHCIDQNAPTIAVLGTGVDDESIYPQSNLLLAHNILNKGGLLISEYPPGTTPHKSHFPARNRIVAGLATATLIIQAALRSGSLITARLAMESNRDVLAVPGPITNTSFEGTNGLIRDGAIPVLEATDILSALHLVPEETRIQERQLSI